MNSRERRDLDVEVASKVMGWKSIDWNFGPPMGEPDDDYNEDYPDSPHRETIPQFSEKIVDAFYILDSGPFSCWSIRWDNELKQAKATVMYRGHRAQAVEDTVQLAICRAALKAVIMIGKKDE